MAREFLHRLPLSLDARLRVELESIAVAVEIIELAMNSLRAGAVEIIALACGPAFELSRGMRLRMIREAWMIVDQLYALRKLIESAGSHIDLESARLLISATSSAINMRNWMDHLKDRMGNLVSSKSPIPPVHGVLTFAFLLSTDLNPPQVGGYHSFRVAIIMGSAMQLPLRFQSMTSDYNTIQADGDHFALQAFDATLNITEAVSLAVAFGEDLATRVEAAFGEETAKRGLNAAELLENKTESGAWIVRATSTSPAASD